MPLKELTPVIVAADAEPFWMVTLSKDWLFTDAWNTRGLGLATTAVEPLPCNATVNGDVPDAPVNGIFRLPLKLPAAFGVRETSKKHWLLGVSTWPEQPSIGRVYPVGTDKVPIVTEVAFSLVSSYSVLVAVLPTATVPRLIGAAGDRTNPPAKEVPERSRKAVLVTLFPRFACTSNSSLLLPAVAGAVNVTLNTQLLPAATTAPRVQVDDGKILKVEAVVPVSRKTGKAVMVRGPLPRFVSVAAWAPLVWPSAAPNVREVKVEAGAVAVQESWPCVTPLP